MLYWCMEHSILDFLFLNITGPRVPKRSCQVAVKDTISLDQFYTVLSVDMNCEPLQAIPIL